MSIVPVAHVGKIVISEELLMKWLDVYPDGKLRTAKTDDWGVLALEIEHPDMPEVKLGDHIPTVSPAYITTSDALGHSVTLRQVGKIR